LGKGLAFKNLSTGKRGRPRKQKIEPAPTP